MLKYSISSKKRSAIRYSEYEDVKTCLKVDKFCKWVWVDCFNKFELNKKTYDLLKNKKFKICLVSPELQGRHNKSEIKNILKNIKKNNFKIDAVCTKFLGLWNDVEK